MRVNASVAGVKDSRLCTVLGGDREGAGEGEGEGEGGEGRAVVVQTVEHLLSALEGCGVDNAEVEIRGGSEVHMSSLYWITNKTHVHPMITGRFSVND